MKAREEKGRIVKVGLEIVKFEGRRWKWEMGSIEEKWAKTEMKKEDGGRKGVEGRDGEGKNTKRRE